MSWSQPKRFTPKAYTPIAYPVTTWHVDNPEDKTTYVPQFEEGEPLLPIGGLCPDCNDWVSTKGKRCKPCAGRHRALSRKLAREQARQSHTPNADRASQ
jgi:hypothetical protein